MVAAVEGGHREFFGLSWRSYGFGACGELLVERLMLLDHGVEHCCAVVVVDRGWIFAGDVRRKDGCIYLSRAVWVFKWESCGFSAVIADPSKADIRPIADVEIPDQSEIFCIPVGESWGLQ